MTNKKLLIHICCAPDFTVAAERLSGEYDITGYFYNPCIHPLEEYEKREKDALYVAEKMSVGFMPAPYNADDFFDIVTGLENEPEKGRRCFLCYKMRLEKCAAQARENRFNFFTTTLTVSPHKDADVINNIGREISKNLGIEFLELNLKKKDGFKRSLELSEKLNLYRQNYCGCIFSKK